MITKVTGQLLDLTIFKTVSISTNFSSNLSLSVWFENDSSERQREDTEEFDDDEPILTYLFEISSILSNRKKMKIINLEVFIYIYY